MQMNLFAPSSSWKAPNLSELPDWNLVSRVGFDVETKDPGLSKSGPSAGLGPGYYRGDGHVAGYGFFLEGHRGFYLPVRHEGGDNLPLENVLRYLRDQARNYRGTLVGANLGYDVSWSKTDGISFAAALQFADVQIAEPLLDELQPSMKLDAISHRRLGENVGKKEQLLRLADQCFFGGTKKKPKNARDTVKENLHKLPARYVGDYCEYDCELPLKIFREQEKELEAQELWPIFRLESQVLPVILKMESRGVLIDQKKLHEVERWSREEEAKALKQIFDLTGIRLGSEDVWGKEELYPLFTALGIKLHKMKTKANGKAEYQIDKALFSEHVKEQPAIVALAWARKVNKLRTTFAKSVWRSLCPDGRIHCSFNQMAMEKADGDEKGCRFGRLSCSNPNLQQQPSRDEFANFWRSIYIPESGAEWVCLDYSQQEPRWTTHFAASARVAYGSELARKLRFSGELTRAAEAAQAYWDDPKLDNHDFMAKLTGLKRKDAKNVYLGVCYGEGGAKLCRDLGLPTAWAVRFGREVTKYKTLSEAMEAANNYEGVATWFETAGDEGQKILDTFDERAPFIRQLANLCKFRAESKGFIRTAGGRKLRFPRHPDGSFDWVHKALNRLIQGTSADQVKTAMVAVDREEPTFFLQLQVHDELDGSSSDRAVSRRVSKLMRECMGATKVPFRVDEEIGPNWGDIKLAA